MNKITINDKEKGRVEMEIVMTYENDNNKYVIYKEVNLPEYYIAKYKTDTSILDTNLTDEEIAFGEKVLEGAINEVKN